MNPTRARLEFIETLLASLRRDLLSHHENFMREKGVDVRLRAEHLQTVRPVVALGVFARYADEAEAQEFTLEAEAPHGSGYLRIAPRLSWPQFHWAVNHARSELARMLIEGAGILVEDDEAEDISEHPHLLPNEAIN